MRLLTDAVLAKLKSHPDSFEIGDGQAPADTSYPYAVLYPLDESDRDGDLAQTDVTGWWEFQITAVGETRMQAEALADRLKEWLRSEAPPTLAGYTAGPWRLGVSIPFDRDDKPQPPEFYSAHTLEIFLAPN